MEETIHINLEAYKTDTHYIGGSKTRLWSAILSSLKWLTTTGIPGNIQSGIGLMIINNLAISVEGFISDIIIEHLDNGEFEKPEEVKNFDNLTWPKKVKKYNSLFKDKLETYSEYKSIEILFDLRNNISHGRTHTEISKTDIMTGQKTVLESVNQKYQKVRLYCLEKKLLVEKDTSSNVDVLWKLNVAAFFFFEVTKFLYAVIRNNESDKKGGILAELNAVYQK